jgi:hypothetical protein
MNHNSQNNLILNDEIEKNLNKKSLGCWRVKLTKKYIILVNSVL